MEKTILDNLIHPLSMEDCSLQHITAALSGLIFDVLGNEEDDCHFLYSYCFYSDMSLSYSHMSRFLVVSTWKQKSLNNQMSILTVYLRLFLTSQSILALG